MIDAIQLGVLNFLLALVGMVLAVVAVFFGADLMLEASACLVIATVEAIWLDKKTTGKVPSPI